MQGRLLNFIGEARHAQRGHQSSSNALTEVAPEIGSQGVVSEVLAGKRALNLRQVKALAKRFAVPMDALTA